MKFNKALQLACFAIIGQSLIAKTIEVHSNNFNTEVLQSKMPVVVDFYANWCGPCKVMSPIIEQLSRELTNVKFVKVNVDSSPDLMNRYNIGSIPTFLFFKGGSIFAKEVGKKTKSRLSKLAKALV